MMTKDFVDNLNHLIQRFKNGAQLEFFNITEYDPASGVFKMDIGNRLYIDINEDKGYLKVEHASEYGIKIENGVLSVNIYAINKNIKTDVTSKETLDIIDVFKDFITEQHNRYHWES